jgi:hypothetical protein
MRVAITTSKEIGFMQRHPTWVKANEATFDPTSFTTYVLPRHSGVADAYAKTLGGATRSVVAEPSPQVRRIKPPRPTVSQAPSQLVSKLPTVDKFSTTNLLPLPSKAKAASPITSTPQTQFNLPTAHLVRERIARIDTERDLTQPSQT